MRKFLLIFFAIVIVIVWNLCKKSKVYRIGEICVDTLKKEIRFKGEVLRDTGYFYFLIYVSGYKWLREKCAIISDVKLSDLQNAIALLNWRLWDSLWTGKERDRFDIFIKCGGKEINAKEIVDADLEFADMIFLGSPYFDPVVLGESATNCTDCPLLPREIEFIEKEILKGKKGFKIKGDFLKRGKKVEIRIKLHG